MALKKFQSRALKNKYGFPPLQGGKTYFICFSGAEKFFSSSSPSDSTESDDHFFSSLSRRDPFGRFFLWFFPLYQDKGKNALEKTIHNQSTRSRCSIVVVHFLLLVQKKTNQKKRTPCENGPNNCHCRKRLIP